MALPKIGIPQFRLDLISGKSIEYRPFTVKEEKVLLIANESKDQRQISGAPGGQVTFHRVDLLLHVGVEAAVLVLV